MTRSAMLLGLLAVGLVLLPGMPMERAVRAEGEPKVTIRVATMAPRTPRFALEEKRANQDLAAATGGRVTFQTYYGGSAGDEQTVLRKMRAGQIDGAFLGVDVISQFVRQALVLMAPQTFRNYKQVDAVRKELAPEFNQEAYKNGFHIISWWDAGKVRIFSSRPIKSFDDLRRGRPWLYPSSPLLREFYKMIGVTGVPLDLPEVYGGLQTGMIDTVWISPVLATALRWTSKTSYVSARPMNIIQGAVVLSRKTYERLSPTDQEAIDRLTRENSQKAQERFRADDEKAYTKILQRGFTAVEFTNPEEWQKAGAQLRERMIGRIYDKALLARVEKIAGQYADQPTDFLVAGGAK